MINSIVDVSTIVNVDVSSARSCLYTTLSCDPEGVCLIIQFTIYPMMTPVDRLNRLRPAAGFRGIGYVVRYSGTHYT